MQTTIVHTIGEEIKLNEIRRNVTAKLSNGKWSYLVNGEWVSQKVFNFLFPKAIYCKPEPKGENPQKRINYIKNQKSY